jgi:RimJ/RimL family protein N-acetyltransferase
VVSMNVARAVDLTGQVTVEAVAQTHYAGVSGILDFIQGAWRSPGGKSILMLPSTTPDGKKSNIIPWMASDVVVVPRASVHHVATEYGVVNLFGKSLQERVLAMISIAHPEFRDELFLAAKQAGMVGPQRSLGEAARAVYPVNLEETIQVNDQLVTIRPAKPVDERRIREHYYSLDKNDVFLRFFHEKTSFSVLDAESKSQIDYIKDMTLVGMVGESGFRRVIAVGEYILLLENNTAEVAFTVAKDFQGKGLGKIFLRKLADAARENGIAGLRAVTAPQNKAMIRLFNSLPYKIRTYLDDKALILSCRFDKLREERN